MKNNFYVVWVGREAGIFNSWEECQKQTLGYEGSRYKKFDSEEKANKAFAGKWYQYYPNSKKIINPVEEQTEQAFVADSFVTTAIVDTKTKMTTIRVIHTTTKTVVLEKQVKYGTLNNAKYIAIVEALKYCQCNTLTTPIYCDNANIIDWIMKYRAPEIKATDKNKQFYTLYANAMHWVQDNGYPNQLLKWDVKSWGMNPAE
ncbi:ribonuclease H1 domain-containing protein [Niabella aquatica]